MQQTNDEYKRALTQCRETIDTIDDQILALLNRRTEAVAEVGRLKQQYEPVYIDRSNMTSYISP